MKYVYTHALYIYTIQCVNLVKYKNILLYTYFTDMCKLATSSTKRSSRYWVCVVSVGSFRVPKILSQAQAPPLIMIRIS